MEVVAIAGLLAIAALVSLILLSRNLGRMESERDQAIEDNHAYERFTEAMNEPLPEDEDDTRDLLRNR